MRKGKKVIQYTLDNKKVKEYDSLNKASIETDTNRGNIYRCCANIVKKANGYKWKFKDSEIKGDEQ